MALRGFAFFTLLLFMCVVNYSTLGPDCLLKAVEFALIPCIQIIRFRGGWRLMCVAYMVCQTSSKVIWYCYKSSFLVHYSGKIQWYCKMLGLPYKMGKAARKSFCTYHVNVWFMNMPIAILYSSVQFLGQCLVLGFIAMTKYRYICILQSPS